MAFSHRDTIESKPLTYRAYGVICIVLAIARVKSENVGATTVLDKVDKVKIKRGILCPTTIGISLIFLLNNVTVQGLAFFLPT